LGTFGNKPKEPFLFLNAVHNITKNSNKAKLIPHFLPILLKIIQ
jgi:hypothetical protein